ncbi:MAG: YraN family protein [Candidatus Aminicenantes bacterium]|nr:YraN family protein [Candidatus Aminicenantes bacterium]
MKEFISVKYPSTCLFGRSGEKMAEMYLKKENFQIIARNFRFLKGEIDIIALDQECLVFIEVKTRTKDTFGFPEEFVSRSKQKQIRRVAEGYLMLNPPEERQCRFDVIAITVEDTGQTVLQHFKNAFE